jgi:hypothetical protein
MANPHKGEVSFVAGEKTYVLHFSAEAVCQLEDKLDMGVNAISKLIGDPERFRMRYLRAMLWAGLLDKQENVDDAMVKEVLLQLRAAEAVELVAKAFNLGFSDEDAAAPAANAGAANGARPPQPPTAAVSGLAG